MATFKIDEVLEHAGRLARAACIGVNQEVARLDREEGRKSPDTSIAIAYAKAGVNFLEQLAQHKGKPVDPEARARVGQIMMEVVDFSVTSGLESASPLEVISGMFLATALLAGKYSDISCDDPECEHCRGKRAAGGKEE